MTADTQRKSKLGIAALLIAVQMNAAAGVASAAGQEPGSSVQARGQRFDVAQAPPAKAATPAAPQQKRAPAKAQGDAGAATAAGGDAGLRQRVEALEEQLVDLQVVIGTLESLAKSGGGGGAAAAAPAWRSNGGSGADAARLEGVETQIRALTAQFEQLSAQARQGGGASANAGGSAGTASLQPTRRPEVGGFGSTVVTPGEADGDAIGGLIAGQPTQGGSPPPATRQPAAMTPLPPVTAPPTTASDAGAKQLYEAAYGHLLQQDYGAAEAAFDDFLKRYPGDGLAGNAQYWLGESHYVRGQYKAAAGAFLKGYQSYGRSAKAPDSLLKLAMSLDRLGQKEQACLSYGELGTKFPNAPAHVKARAQSERQRIGCS